jgi:hypothetical protein
MRQRTAVKRGWMLGLVMLAAASGCVERRMVIITEPYGAIVYDEKNQPIGGAPVDHPFTYYGKYNFRLAKDGYETLRVEQRVRAPWYELPGLDFISENLIPFTVRDVRYFRYVLQPLQDLPADTLLRQAEQLRAYGATIGPPVVDLPPPTVASPSVLMPPVP